MESRTERRIVIGTLIACALTCALPAAAADGGTLADRNDPHAGLAGRPLSDEEMGDMRGRYVPPGSTVIVQIGNGDSTSTTYSQRNPATPGSATVTTTGTTLVTGYAATSGSSSIGSTSRTFSFGTSVGTSYRVRY
jgi:hypothetical protein